MARAPRKTFPHYNVRIEVADFPGPVGKDFMLWSLPRPFVQSSHSTAVGSNRSWKVAVLQERHLLNNQGWGELWGSGVEGRE